MRTIQTTQPHTKGAPNARIERLAGRYEGSGENCELHHSHREPGYGGCQASFHTVPDLGLRRVAGSFCKRMKNSL